MALLRACRDFPLPGRHPDKSLCEASRPSSRFALASAFIREAADATGCARHARNKVGDKFLVVDRCKIAT